ncbi:NADH-quinone oxidoreductase subunit NuoK [bacterium]|nr:NADH-quinone oxidoreductase subunit NuoK [bacterium]
MQNITVVHYLILSAAMFGIGLWGVVLRKNLLIVFMCIEIMLNAANLSFVALARYFGKMEAHVVVFFVMAVAAAEAAVGLAIVIMMYRNRHTVRTDEWRIMGG